MGSENHHKYHRTLASLAPQIEDLLKRLAERRVAAETHERAAGVLSKLEAARQVGKANVRLTDAFVREALPGQRTYLLWDRDVKGFGVRIYPSGTKTFVVTYRPVGLRMKEWYTIGRSTVISASRAREEARTILAKNRLGENLAAKRRAARQSNTSFDGKRLDDLIERYFKIEGARLAESTVRIWKRLARVYLSETRVEIEDAELRRTLRASTDSEDWTGRRVRLGAVPVALVSQAMLSDLWAFASEKRRVNGRVRGGKRLADQCIILASALFRFAAKQKPPWFEGPSPTTGISRHGFTRRTRTLSSGEWRALYRALRELREEYSTEENRKIAPLALPSLTAIEVISLTPCRIESELLCRLKSDLKTVEITNGSGPEVRYLLKQGKRKSSTAPPHIWLSHRAAKLLLSLQDSEGEYLFPGRTPDCHLTRRPVSTYLRKACERAGIEDLTLHDFKRSVVNVMEGLNIDPQVRSYSAGTTVEVLGESYSVPVHETQFAAADQVERQVGIHIGLEDGEW